MGPGSRDHLQEGECLQYSNVYYTSNCDEKFSTLKCYVMHTFRLWTLEGQEYSYPSSADIGDFDSIFSSKVRLCTVHTTYM
jgi:hypothetical protein